MNPLDGIKKTSFKFQMHQYFLKVVGTEYTYLNTTILNTNQFAVTEHDRDVSPQFGVPTGIPGVFFMFEISPMVDIFNTDDKNQRISKTFCSLSH